MGHPLPLSALLSQALVAYTIEFDNEFEHRAPHITTVGRGGGKGEWPGPWLTSQAMWTNFIRYIAADGTPVRDLQAMACISEPAIKSRLHHLEWWRYLTLAPDPADTRAKPRYRDLLVHLTSGGKRARDEWKPLNTLIDKRWRTRFGKAVIDELTGALRSIVSGVEGDQPDYLPVVDFPGGFPVKLLPSEDPLPQKRIAVDRLDISALLSRALLALALDFESESDVSITIAANVLRVVPEAGAATRDLPLRGGVAKEGVTVALNFLSKNGFLKIGSEKDKVVRLTAKGKDAQKTYAATVERIEKQWERTFGKPVVSSLRNALQALEEPGKSGRSGLAEGIEPRAGAWRTDKRYARQTEAYLSDPRGSLPHYPFISHRGGFPDGN